MVEKRAAERMPFNDKIDFLLPVSDFREIKKLSLSCSATDISSTGMGIVLDYPLEPGHVLQFNSFTPSFGIVRWSRKVEGSYRAGVQFV
ncbi:MAG: PilZ domain-containing protein [Nitrospirae bacterium]|nr:PilZ domain-containing protein [Nitrospirota bacterium]